MDADFLGIEGGWKSDCRSSWSNILSCCNSASSSFDEADENDEYEKDAESIGVELLRYAKWCSLEMAEIGAAVLWMEGKGYGMSGGIKEADDVSSK